MAIIVEEDIIAGMRLSENENGLIVKRVFKVKNLPEVPGNTIAYRALTTEGIPKYSDPHPSLPGLHVTSRDTEPVLNSKTDIRVFIGYLDISVVQVRISGAVTQEMTSFDVNSELMIVRWNPANAANTVPKANTDGTMEMTAEVPVLRPGVVLTYYWSDIKDTNEQSKWFQGCTNAQEWNGGADETWVCEEYSTEGQIKIANKLAGRPTIWRKQARFRYRGPTKTHTGFKDKHEKLMLYRDPFTRKIPASIDTIAGGFPKKREGNGWLVSQVTPFVDFDDLKLPQVFKN